MDPIEKRLAALELENKKLRSDIDKLGSKKKTRAPSAYNIFVKEAIAHLKKQNPDLSHKERFKLAVGQWREQKNQK